MTAEPAAPASADDLRVALDRLEVVPYDDPHAAAQPARSYERRALELGLEDLAMRARLVHADVVGRLGETAAAGAIVRQVGQWAAEHDHAHLAARSERLLSAFWTRVGDAPAALEHAVRSVETLPDDVTPRLRADHLMALALALARMRSYDAARDRFEEVLLIADATDDVRLRLSGLNNLAFIEYWAGEPQAAMQAAERLTTFAQHHGVELEASYLDTVARAQMMLGRFADAEETLMPLLDGRNGTPVAESDGIAEVLLTIAECQRKLGRIDRAQGSLTHAAELCDVRNLQEVRVRVRCEQATLYAAEGRFREAYEAHVEFHQAGESLYSAERDARARTLQAVFETEEAQRTSRQFREMSLRDPLTGLYNRRYVDDRLPALVSRSREEAMHLAVALADLDDFKRVNDELSHDTGDEVLRQVAAALQESVSGHGGFAARMGGEEFLIVMPGLDAAAAFDRCEQLRRMVSGLPWSAVVGDIPVTLSLGVAAAFAGSATAPELLALADERLYASKRAGRNRVTAA